MFSSGIIAAASVPTSQLLYSTTMTAGNTVISGTTYYGYFRYQNARIGSIDPDDDGVFGNGFTAPLYEFRRSGTNEYITFGEVASAYVNNPPTGPLNDDTTGWKTIKIVQPNGGVIWSKERSDLTYSVRGTGYTYIPGQGTRNTYMNQWAWTESNNYFVTQAGDRIIQLWS